MSEWKEYSLEDLAFYYNGKAFKPSDWKKEGVKIIRIEQLNNPEGYYDYYQGDFPEINKIENGHLIFSWSATLKVVIWKHGNAVLNQHLFKVIPKSLIEKTFLFFILDYNMLKLGDTSHGSTMKHIKRGELKKYFVKIPPLPTQRKIARILSTADAVIEKTQAAIAKYKAIKQGMLHDLFTRGIDPKTNKIRPKYQDNPELYKVSKLDWIPKVWEVERLGNVGELKNGVNKDKNSFGFGTLFVNIIDAYPEILDCSKLGRVNINENEKHVYELINGDIIFVRSSVKPEGVGYNTLFIDFNEPVVYCGFMIRYRFNNKIDYIPEFFNSYFRFDDFRRRLIASSTVSANTNINQVALGKLLAIKPKKIEQIEIIKRLETIDNKLQTEQNYLHKLQQIKAGLMADLLGGKKEVIVEEELNN